MSNHTASLREPLVRMDKLPWVTFLIITAIFFYTLHDFFHTRSYLDLGVDVFNPPEEEAVEIMAKFEAGQLRNAVAYTLLGLFGLVTMLLPRRNRLALNGLFGLLMLFLVFWTFSSVLWAESPDVTVKKLAILAMMCIAVVSVSRRFSDRDLILFTFYSTGAFLAIGLTAEIALGTFQPQVAGWRFSGTCHPNSQALNTGLLFLAALYLRNKEGKRRWYGAVAVIAFVCLVLTKSRTGIGGASLAAVLFWVLAKPWSTRTSLYCLFAVLFVIVLSYAEANLPRIEEGSLLGRTDTDVGQVRTLTGRTDLWGATREYMTRRALLGYGYVSFWTVEHIERIAGDVGFVPSTAHSAYVDVVLSLGLVGLFLFVLVYFIGIRLTIDYYRSTGGKVYAFYGAVLIYALLHSLTESSFLFPALSTFVSLAILVRLGFQAPPEPSGVSAAGPSDRAGTPLSAKVGALPEAVGPAGGV